MAKPFKGVINLDVRDSIPDWEPYAQPKAPEGSPNVLFLVWDDTGFGALEPFGGPIEMPNMKRLADNGLRYTQFHTTAICSPTRAALLTGRNHTTVGMACIAEATTGFPGMNGHIPFETATIAEVLGEQGYNTYMLGKWHCVAEDETNMASSKRNWPTGRGFERYYGFLGGETNQYYPDLVQDQQFVEQPSEPASIEGWKEGKAKYHLSADLVDHAIGMIADAKQVAPERRSLCTSAQARIMPRTTRPRSGRTSTRASSTWATKRSARRSWRSRRRWASLPENTELSPDQPACRISKSVDGKPMAAVDMVRPWDSLSEDEKKLFIRMAEVYAGFCSYTDHEIGRLIDYLGRDRSARQHADLCHLGQRRIGRRAARTVRSTRTSSSTASPTSMEENLTLLDMLGSPETYNHYPTGWAMAFNTPFKLFKRRHLGRRRLRPDDRALAQGHQGQGRTARPVHARALTSCRPSTNAWASNSRRGQGLHPVAARRHRASSTALTMPKPRRRSRASSTSCSAPARLWRDGWKVDAIHAGAPSGWSHFAEDKWALYHVDDDRSECTTSPTRTRSCSTS